MNQTKAEKKLAREAKLAELYKETVKKYPLGSTLWYIPYDYDEDQAYRDLTLPIAVTVIDHGVRTNIKDEYIQIEYEWTPCYSNLATKQQEFVNVSNTTTRDNIFKSEKEALTSLSIICEQELHNTESGYQQRMFELNNTNNKISNRMKEITINNENSDQISDNTMSDTV